MEIKSKKSLHYKIADGTLNDYPEIEKFPGNDPNEISEEARAKAIEMELALLQFHYEFSENDLEKASNEQINGSNNKSQKCNTEIKLSEKQDKELSKLKETKHVEKKVNSKKNLKMDNHTKYGFKMNSMNKNKHFYKPDPIRDKQRFANEEIESKLLEFEDYEFRLDDDFIGSGRKVYNSYKTISRNFYNSEDLSIDPRKLADDLELKLYEHSRNNERNLDECLFREPNLKDGKVTSIPDVDLNDDEMLNMRTEDSLEDCLVSIKQCNEVLCEKDVEFEEFAADSSHVAFLYE